MFKRKVLFTIMVAVLIVVSVFCFDGCQEKKHGPIPYGSYAMYEDGEILQTPMEYVWLVFDEIECMYAKYEFVLEDERMFFKCKIEQKQAYLVKYDEEKAILSIYLPKEMYTDHQSAIFSDDYVWMNFKRK